MNHELAFPKPTSNKSSKRTARVERRKGVKEELIDKHGNKCQVYLLLNHHEVIDLSHIVKKRPNAPWLDIAENNLLHCRTCHPRFELEKEFREWAVKQQLGKRPELKWAYNYVSGEWSKDQFETKLKEIYNQRIGE